MAMAPVRSALLRSATIDDAAGSGQDSRSFSTGFHLWCSLTPQILFLSLCVVIPSTLVSSSAPSFVTDFYFDSFNASFDSQLTFLRDSFVDNNQVYLTSTQIPVNDPANEDFIAPLSHGIGRVLYAKPIRGRDPLTGQTSSFSTTFIFSIMNPDQMQVGDGLAFLIATNNSVVGSGGQYLGVLDQSANGFPYAHTFAVEFDTWQNPELLDPDGNHVGVDVNSMISQKVSTAGFWTGDNVFHLLPLTGLRLQAWIDYSSQLREIQVSISPLLGSKPTRPLLSVPIDFNEVMVQEEMFVGFSAATGDLSAEHVIHAWSFNTSGPAQDFLVVYGATSRKQLQLIRWLCVAAASLMIILIGLTVWTLIKSSNRRQHRSSSKVHIGDPEAVVLPPDPIRDAAQAQAKLNISKILAERHMLAFTEGR